MEGRGRAALTASCCLLSWPGQIATEGFKADKLLSDKPHGSVHRAEGPNGEQWAVKRAKGVSLIGEHLFRNEVWEHGGHGAASQLWAPQWQSGPVSQSQGCTCCARLPESALSHAAPVVLPLPVCLPSWL